MGRRGKKKYLIGNTECPRCGTPTEMYSKDSVGSGYRWGICFVGSCRTKTFAAVNGGNVDLPKPVVEPETRPEPRRGKWVPVEDGNPIRGYCWTGNPVVAVIDPSYNSSLNRLLNG